MSISFPTQGCYVVYMCPDIIFQILLLCSRPMTSHHVTCHVTVVSHAFFIVQKKNKKKLLVSKMSHNIEVYGKIVGLGESNIMFRMNSNVWMISLISKE